MQNFHVFIIKQACILNQQILKTLLDFDGTLIGQVNATCPFIKRKVSIAHNIMVFQFFQIVCDMMHLILRQFSYFLLANFTTEAINKFIYLMIFINVIFSRTTDDQGCTCFVNKDAVHLIDHSKIKITLDIVLKGKFHVVAQIIKTELVVCPICNVCSISAAAAFIINSVLNQANL